MYHRRRQISLRYNVLMLTLILMCIFALIAVVIAWAAYSGAPWVPAFKRDIRAVLDDAGVKKGDLFIELGSGDGRLVLEAARRGATAIGYEINPLLWIVSWLRIFPMRKNAKVYLRDFWGVDISKADVVLAFLVPRTMSKLEAKAKAEMKKGSRLLSYIFELPNTKAKMSRHHWHVYKF